MRKHRFIYVINWLRNWSKEKVVHEMTLVVRFAQILHFGVLPNFSWCLLFYSRHHRKEHFINCINWHTLWTYWILRAYKDETSFKLYTNDLGSITFWFFIVILYKVDCAKNRRTVSLNRDQYSSTYKK